MDATPHKPRKTKPPARRPLLIIGSGQYATLINPEPTRPPAVIVGLTRLCLLLRNLRGIVARWRRN